jgi:ABC-type branched-subunit amino acid transport system ATPase component
MRFGSTRLAGEVYLRPRLARLALRGLFFQPATETLSRRHTLRWQFDVMKRQTGQAFPWDLVERLGLGDVLDQTPFDLSGGEIRKACIALALARRPRCLLADEPLSGIAPRDQEEVAKGIGNLAAGGAAVMVTGHEVEPLLDLAHEVIWMVAGTTHGLGAPEEVRSHAQFQREYLAGRWA